MPPFVQDYAGKHRNVRISRQVRFPTNPSSARRNETKRNTTDILFYFIIIILHARALIDLERHEACVKFDNQHGRDMCIALHCVAACVDKWRARCLTGCEKPSHTGPVFDEELHPPYGPARSRGDNVSYHPLRPRVFQFFFCLR